MSPLHIAVIHAHPGIVKYLIEKGADINLNDRCGMSPLFYALAITIGHPRISFDLIKYSSSLAQGIDVESVFNNLLHNDNPNPNYGLASKERHRNRGLFRLHGIGNQNRKNMN